MLTRWIFTGSILLTTACASQTQATSTYLFNDSHFHLTNYVQQGTDIQDYLDIMGDKVGRSTLFGIPLQQTWSHENTGDFAPTYYLQSDAPLYYYSFTDAFIAQNYLSLSEKQKKRLDPMITGFNPADMYAVEHIQRVLKLFPGVFVGLGEFTIHKEFVSAKVAGDTASLSDPALDRILKFAGEAGLIVLIHNDIDMPFAKPDTKPTYYQQMVDLLKRHPDTTIIWAHMGLGRVVHPVQSSQSIDSDKRNPIQLDLVEAILKDPQLKHVYFDISWDEVAKYAIQSPDIIDRASRYLNIYSDRFLFGTDNVAPPDQATQLRVYHMWDPIWAKLTEDSKYNVTQGNYLRLFDEANKKVRAWEKANLK